ncbi:MAG: P-loop NTPase family protein [Clostridia bacterium]
MEDNREDLLIIFAGYADEMEEFLLSNTGLKSRIPYLFHFNAYSEMELLEIAQIMISEKNYNLTDQAVAALKEIINKLAPLSNNSNARMIRNLIERIEREQNFRLYKTNDCDLMRIEEPDILKAI